MQADRTLQETVRSVLHIKLLFIYLYFVIFIKRAQESVQLALGNCHRGHALRKV